MKSLLKSLLARYALAQPIRGLVVHLIYPAIVKCLEGECQPFQVSSTGFVRAFAWKTHSYQVISSELARGADCCANAPVSPADTWARIVDVILKQLEDVPGDIFEFGVSSGSSFLVFLMRCPD